MNYTRLTNKETVQEFKKAPINDVSKLWYLRLAELEDKIESGELVKNTVKTYIQINKGLLAETPHKANEKVIEKIAKVVSSSCNSKGIAKRCPERISQAIYEQIVEPLENKLELTQIDRNIWWEELQEQKHKNEVLERALKIAVKCAREEKGTTELMGIYERAEKHDIALGRFTKFCLEQAEKELKGATKNEKE